MIFSKKKWAEVQLRRDRDIIARLLPAGTHVMLVNGYRALHSCILGREGVVNGSCEGGTILMVKFFVSGSLVEEPVPMNVVLDHVRVIGPAKGGETHALFCD